MEEHEEIFDEEQPIGVYIRVNDKNEVVEVNSEIFISDLTDWIKIDDGYGDLYAHAQSNYLSTPLYDENGNCNYRYTDEKLTIIPEYEKPKILPSYAELVEQKIRVRYTVSDELAILRQRDTKPEEFEEYNAYCEECKAQARRELQ